MRRAIRDQIVGILGTILEGIAYAGNAEPKYAHQVLEDCQETMSAIVEALKEGLTQGRFVQLETIIAQIRGNLNAGASATEDMPEALEGAAHTLKILTDELLRDADVRHQIVFMPYNSSMWDAMESVWRAASRDPACDVYVVPLPYYERDPNGAAQSLRYEGNRFPQYVPITHYNDYNIIYHHPDIVYIHNVYNGGNRVTSVVPDYYTQRLKRYTDLLVYIPYYIAGSGVSEHFYSLDGIKDVGCVVVESEKEARRFAQYWSRDKIVALGSPKVEKTITLNGHPPNVPAAWRPLIKGKKVILYNTSIATMLTYSDAYIAKLERVLDFFDTRDDMTLLWRPHPLLKSTLKSMRPYLLERYLALERRFLSGKKGIWDTTTDAYAAFYVSDAYFGDASSLADAYGMTGKPVMIQDPRITLTKSECMFAGIPAEGDPSYLFMSDYNGLLHTDVACGTANTLRAVPGERGYYLYGFLLKHNDTIVCVPASAQEIALYKINDASFAKYVIPAVKTPYLPMNAFSFAIPYDHYIYMFGYFYPGIVRLDIRSGETICIDNWLWGDKALAQGAGHDVYFNRSYCVQGETVYAPLDRHPGVLILNLRSGRCEIMQIHTDAQGYGSICLFKEWLWLFPHQTGAAIRVQIKTRQCDAFAYPREAMIHKYGSSLFMHSYMKGGYIWLFPYYCDAAHIRINPETGEMLPIFTGGNLKPHSFYSVFTHDKNGLAATTYDGTFLFIDLSEDAINIHPASIALDSVSVPAWGETIQSAYEDFYLRAHAACVSSAYRLYESTTAFTMSCFFEKLDALKKYGAMQARDHLSAFTNADGTCGQEIHKEMLKRMDGMLTQNL